MVIGQFEPLANGAKEGMGAMVFVTRFGDTFGDHYLVMIIVNC